jgi:two-component system heavy metal sensor histidine kinase CusS
MGAKREGSAGDAGVEARAQEILAGMERLTNRVQAAERYIAHAAHELKTPLANLRGELQLALMRERTREQYKLAISNSLEHTNQLIELTSDLLMLAMISQASRRPDPRPYHVKAVVLEAIQLASQRALAPRELDVDVPEELSAFGRSDETTRMLRNLLDNALEHSPQGATVRIGARAMPEDRFVEIVVENDGPPIDAELAAEVFQPFRRGSSGSDRGIGLGLSIARAVAESAGGSIELDTSATSPRFVVRLVASDQPVRSA